MMSTDFDALLGGAAPKPIPDSTSSQKLAAIRNARAGKTFVEAGEFKRPVTKNFIAQVFDMDPATVTKRLLACPTLTSPGDTRPLYDFKQAVAYLVEPKMDIEAYIKNLDPNRMPNHINKVFWEAARVRLKFMIEAGDAWLTGEVLDVFGLVFMTIKDRMQLWTETLRERGGLSDETLARMTQMIDALQEDLHQQLVDIPKQRQTKSLVAEHANELLASEDLVG